MSISKRNLPTFTPRQGEYLAFIHAYTCVMDKPPAEADIRKYFSVSPPTIHQMILGLEKAGLISRQPATARSILLLIPPELLPILRRKSDGESIKSSVSRY